MLKEETASLTSTLLKRDSWTHYFQELVDLSKKLMNHIIGDLMFFRLAATLVWKGSSAHLSEMRGL